MAEKRVISRDSLQQLYVEEALPVAAVAKRLRASVHTVRRNLVEHGIPVRGNREAHRSHSMSATRQYRIWQGLKSRCTNRRCFEYSKYGALGISYPPKWERFEGFWDDMADGYADDKTIDRIDGSKGYSKQNCRWVDYQGQNRNKADNVLLTHNGKTQCVAAWAEEVDIPQCTLYNRKARGWTDEQVLTTPVQEQYSRT
jgi:hypothetical protein